LKSQVGLGNLFHVLECFFLVNLFETVLTVVVKMPADFQVEVWRIAFVKFLCLKKYKKTDKKWSFFSLVSYDTIHFGL